VPWRHLLALLRLGPPVNSRITALAQTSAAHDPATRHWRVELVGVEPALQGRGIGGKLMEAVLRQVDAAGEPAYLETDTPDNVAFYQRRGFAVIAEQEALGVGNWYMERSTT
jgi:GNAT superfamily N-acetyltransferase